MECADLSSRCNRTHRQIFRSGVFATSYSSFSWSPAPTTGCPRPRTVTSVINRYYDPGTDQFMSVDPLVVETGQAYALTNDDPLNGTDPLGLKGWYCMNGQSVYYKGNKYGVKGTGKCASEHAPRPTTKNAPSSNKSGSSGSTSQNFAGQALSGLANVTANIGLGLDIAGAGSASAGELEVGGGSFGLAAAVNVTSAAATCVADYANGQTLMATVAGCTEQGITLYVTEGKAAAGVPSEIVKWFGDIQTSLNDALHFPER